jgi:hypothetical protein
MQYLHNFVTRSTGFSSTYSNLVCVKYCCPSRRGFSGTSEDIDDISDLVRVAHEFRGIPNTVVRAMPWTSFASRVEIPACRLLREVKNTTLVCRGSRTGYSQRQNHHSLRTGPRSRVVFFAIADYLTSWGSSKGDLNWNDEGGKSRPSLAVVVSVLGVAWCCL